MSQFVLSAFADEAGQSLDAQIAALRRNGIRFMEIRNVNGLNICKTPLDTVKEYKQKLDAAGIRVKTVGSCIGKTKLTDDYDEHIALFVHTLDAAEILGAEAIRMFSFNKATQADEKEVMSRLQQMLDMARGTGITLYHENEKDIYGDTDSRVLQLMNAFSGQMKFIFDPANFIQCGCDPWEIYPRLKKHISYFHIKDALHATKGVVPAGEGDGSIAKLLKDFAAEHENTMLTVEPHLKSFSGLKDPASIRSETIYKDNDEAFDTAVAALKKILDKENLSYE